MFLEPRAGSSAPTELLDLAQIANGCTVVCGAGGAIGASLAVSGVWSHNGLLSIC